MTRRDGLLVVAVYLGLAALLAGAHVARIDRPRMEAKLEHHAATLANLEPDPYQYKFAAITWAVEGLHRATGVSLRDAYIANTYLSLLALLLAHHAWLARLYGRREAFLGTFLLAGLAHGLFLDYVHHPYELWGVAGFCWMLRAVVAERGFGVLAALGFACGFVWEKQALVPLLAGAWRWRRGAPFARTAVGAGLAAAASLAVPVAVRLLCGTDRPAVDVTGVLEQRWDWVVARQVPFLLPPLLVAIATWRRLPDWVRWLWLYVPVLFFAYLLAKFQVHEIRSFWAWAPVFTATIVGWTRTWDADPAATPTA